MLYHFSEEEKKYTELSLGWELCFLIELNYCSVRVVDCKVIENIHQLSTVTIHLQKKLPLRVGGLNNNDLFSS